MNRLDAYNIDIFRLSNGTHAYNFEVSSAFFEVFEDGEVTDGRADVLVRLSKSEAMIEVGIQIKGTVRLTCDRSLEVYDHTLETNDRIIFKYGDSWEELSDEIITIAGGEQHINLAQYIYEFIELAIPMKKLHPKFEQNNNTGELVYSSFEEEENENPVAEEGIDPRWEKLKRIKNKAYYINQDSNGTS